MGNILQSQYPQFTLKSSIMDRRFGQVNIWIRGNQLILQKTFTLQDPYIRQDFLEQCQSSKNLQHPSLLKVLNFSQENIEQISIFVEYYESDLSKEIIQRGIQQVQFSEDEVWVMVEKLVSVGAYLQTQGIYHGDLNSSNIFLDNQGVPKIVDYGLIHPIKEGRITTLHIQDKTYLSPELLDAVRNKQSNPDINYYKNDVFTLGMSLLQVITLTSMHICYNWNLLKLNSIILNEFVNQIELNFSQRIVKIIKSMLSIEVIYRPDFVILQQTLEDFRKTVPIKNPIFNTKNESFNNKLFKMSISENETQNNRPMRSHHNTFHVSQMPGARQSVSIPWQSRIQNSAQLSVVNKSQSIFSQTQAWQLTSQNNNYQKKDDINNNKYSYPQALVDLQYSIPQQSMIQQRQPSPHQSMIQQRQASPQQSIILQRQASPMIQRRQASPLNNLKFIPAQRSSSINPSSRFSVPNNINNYYQKINQSPVQLNASPARISHLAQGITGEINNLYFQDKRAMTNNNGAQYSNQIFLPPNHIYANGQVANLYPQEKSISIKDTSVSGIYSMDNTQRKTLISDDLDERINKAIQQTQITIQKSSQFPRTSRQNQEDSD